MSLITLTAQLQPRRITIEPGGATLSPRVCIQTALDQVSRNRMTNTLQTHTRDTQITPCMYTCLEIARIYAPRACCVRCGLKMCIRVDLQTLAGSAPDDLSLSNTDCLEWRVIGGYYQQCRTVVH